MKLGGTPVLFSSTNIIFHVLALHLPLSHLTTSLHPFPIFPRLDPLRLAFPPLPLLQLGDLESSVKSAIGVRSFNAFRPL